MEQEFKWVFCETCNCAAVICPKCDNNCCNAQYGLEGKCDVCPLAYQYQELAYQAEAYPLKRNLEIIPAFDWTHLTGEQS